MVRIKLKISLMIFGILLLSLYFCINPLYIDFQGRVLIKSNELNKKYIKLSDILPIGKGQLSAYLILDSEERNKIPNNIAHCKILYTDDTTIVKKLLNLRFLNTQGDMCTDNSRLVICENSNKIFTTYIILEDKIMGLQSNVTGWIEPTDKESFCDIFKNFRRYNYPLLIKLILLYHLRFIKNVLESCSRIRNEL